MGMLLILAAAVGSLIPLLDTKIKKRPGVWYMGALFLSLCALLYLILGKGMPGYASILEIFGRGELATVLFIYVMLAPVLPEKKKLTLSTYRIRGELAILAVFLMWPHNVYFGRTYFVRLVTDPGSLSQNTLLASICSIAMLILLVPLTVTSFKKVRRKMKPRKWKRLQRLSYLFYALLYVHIMLVLAPNLGRSADYALKAAFYTAVFGCYATLRVNKYLKVKKKAGTVAWRRIERGGLLATAAVCAFLVSSGFQAAGGDEVRAVNSQAIADDETRVANSQAIADDEPRVANSQVIDGDETRAVNSQAIADEGGAAADSGLAAGETCADDGLLASERETIGDGGRDRVSESETLADITGDGNIWKDGTWSGEGTGYYGKVQVDVTIVDGKIAEVKVTGYADDPEYFAGAANQVTKAIVENQDAQVDAVSGATYSSKGIMEAAEDALAKAE